MVSKKTAQIALTGCRTRPHQRTDQHLFLCDQSLLSPYSSTFLCMFLPKSPWSFLFPTSGFCPKYPIISPVQSWNALPLHPSVSHAPRQWPSTVGKVSWRAASTTSWWRLSPAHGAEGLLGQSWRSQAGAVSLTGLLGLLHLPWALVFLHGCGDGPLVGWWLGWTWDEVEQGVIWAPPPTFVSLCSSVCGQSSFLARYLTTVLLECIAKSPFSS